MIAPVTLVFLCSLRIYLDYQVEQSAAWQPQRAECQTTDPYPGLTSETWSLARDPRARHRSFPRDRRTLRHACPVAELARLIPVLPLSDPSCKGTMQAHQTYRCLCARRVPA